MDKIYLVSTSSINRDVGHVTSEPIIAFGSRAAAKEFMNERKTEDERQKDYFIKEGVYDIKWFMEEIGLNDMNLNADAKDRQESKWKVQPADNGWTDWICANCEFTDNVDNRVILDYQYCPKCGCRMVNPNGGKK